MSAAASPLPLGMGRCRGEGRKDGPSVRSSARPRHPPQLLLSIRCSRDQPGTGLLPPAAPPRPFRLWPAWPERGPAGPRAPLLARGRFRSAERQAAVAGRQATPDPPWKPGLPLRLPGLGDPAPRTCRPAPAAPPPSPPLPPAPQPSPRLSCSLHASPSRHRSLPRVSQISVLRAGPRHLSLFPGLFLSLGLWARHSPKSSVLCPVPAAVRGHGGGRHPWAGGRQRSRGYEIPRDVRARRARRTAGTEPRLQETPPPPPPGGLDGAVRGHHIELPGAPLARSCPSARL